MRIARLLCLVVLSLLTLASAACAGSGYIKDGRVNLVVWFEYKETDLERWKQLFNDTNRLLWQATDGRLQFGEIRFTYDVNAKETADIRVALKESGRAAVYGLRKGRSGVDTPACYTQLYRNGHKFPATLLHELGHYLFSLKDEYRGAKWTWTDGKWAQVMNAQGYWWHDYTGPSRKNNWFCATREADNDAAACIMDSANGYKDGRVSFCLDGSHGGAHVKGYKVDSQFLRNSQQYEYGGGCWKTIAQVVGLPIPTAPPANETEPAASPTFQLTTGNLFVIALQRDAGLAENTLERMRKAAASALGQATLNTRFCIYAFDSNTLRVYGYDSLTADTLRKGRAAIRTIKRAGATANLAWVLATIRDDIANQEQARGQRYARRTVLVLGDGKGTAPTSDVLVQLRRAYVRVDTAAVRAGSDTTLLKRVATQTQGRYRGGVQNSGTISAQAEEDALDADAVDLAADAFGDDVLVDAAPVIAPGATDTRTFVVDAYHDRLDLDVDYGQGAPPKVRLSAPDGTLIDPQAPPSDVTVDEGDGLLQISVQRPAAGTWALAVDNTGSPTPEAVDITVSAEDTPALDVEATCEDDTVAWPRAILVRASAEVDGGVPGAQARATVTAPDGRQSTLALYDDGLEEHGDDMADDGVYSGYFTDARGPGVYTFDARITSSGGTSTQNSFDCAPSESPLPAGTRVEPFTRLASVSVELTGTATGTALLPPAGATDETSSLDAITLTWRDTNRGAAAYVVQRSDDGETFRDYATVGAQTTFTDKALTPASRVTYRVVARTSEGDSAPSDLVQVDMGAIDQGLASVPSETAAQASAGQGGAVASGGGCFIATAAYGSSLDPHVASLRRFRDDWLMTNGAGRWLVTAYYRHSPPLAAWLATHAYARAVVRGLLWPVVLTVEHTLLVLGMVLVVVVRLRRAARRRVPAH